MKISKRQLRRIIREAIDPREMEEPLGGYAGNALHNDPDFKHHTDTDTVVAEIDYEKGFAAGKGSMALSPYANDDYAAGYEDGIAERARINSLQEAGKGWQLRDRSCNTHNMPPDEVAEAMAILQEFGYELGVPITVDSNNIAIDDALGAYPGEFTYEDFRCAIQVTQGRGG